MSSIASTTITVSAGTKITIENAKENKCKGNEKWLNTQKLDRRPFIRF